MADDCSNDRSNLSGSTRRLLHEFPLSSRSLLSQHENAGTAASPLNGLAQEVQTLARELSQGRRLEVPASSLIPTLPKTPYKEQFEKEFERSPEYVQVQRQILKAIEKHDIALTSKEAYKWTSNSVPKGQRPQPLQALRLCYYMRSLGYDTFATIKTSCDPGNGTKITALRLLVANPDSEKRGLGHDHLYWAQDIRTGEAVSKAYKLRRSF
ncbi:hypothetical protein BU25DRAFT_40544 [Macroventuria anomochaeta]|uniref:Uncharacterized protein n=1 Tax=Macroventuria anomochaeta TaxID=301207 RepID=A0ACB6S1G1_9PLEO|nr:uncharacterized protein BU25DRAFT_40544 [Macroventuria anomochaeta]KAF2628130.1 hypothetical protein BU25DRAFT_40544 [Macroventuria anomochaeta]